MATIQIILQAINNASAAFNDVASAAEQLAAAEELAAEGSRKLSEAELAAANSALDAVSAYARLRDEFGADAAAAALAADAVGNLEERLMASGVAVIAAADAFRMLTDAELAAAQAALETGVTTTAAAEACIRAGLAAVQASQGIRLLDRAEIDSINTSLAWREALTSVEDAETGVAVRAGVAAAALTALNARIIASGNAAGNALTGFNAWRGVMTVLQAQIPLWGGLLDGLAPKILTQVGAWHVWADAIIEVIAVWAGAAIAVAAFALAAQDAFNNVVRQVTNMHTVMDATGQSFNSMTGNLEAMHKAVQPEVYQIFGDALTVLTKKGSELNTVILQTGKVLDDLAARAAVAMQSSGFSSFTQNAVTDVRLLGTAFGNLFGIIGNLVRMNQGWATTLLQAGTAILGLVERITGLIIPLGQLLVLGHGFVLWVGLGVTAALKFGSAILGWGANLVNAVTGFAGLIGAIRQYIAVYGIMDALSLVNPMAWIGIAVGAIAGLVFWLSGAKSAVQQYGDAVMKTAEQATTLTGAISELQQGVAQSATMASTAQAAATAANDKYAHSAITSKQALAEQAAATYSTTAAANEAAGVHQQLSGELGTVNTRLTSLSKTYGGTQAALGLLNAAGITNTQMLDQSSGAWQIIQQEVAATDAAYKAMGNQTGVLGNDLAVLNKQATDQYQAIQKLNQAWDTQTSAVTGTQTTFDTIAQGFQTLGSSTATFTNSLGRLRVNGINFVKSGIDQLTPSGIALNQAFSQQVGNINSLADSWRSAGVSQNLFVQGIAAGIAPLEKYAAGSSEATAQLVSLAEEAGYQGPNNLNALNQFLGITSSQLKNTSGDMQKMKDIANQATIQEALLTGAMQAQGAVIANQLIGDINKAILAYNGVDQAATKYGTAVAQFGRQSDQAQAARNQLIKDLIASGQAAGDSTKQIAAMITKILGIPAKVALQIVMTGEGIYSIKQGPGSLVAKSQGPGGSGSLGGGLAAGGLIRSGTGPRADDVIVAVSRGELVVPAHMVNAGAVDHLRGSIPGFASGGLVGGGHLAYAGNRAVLSGDFAVGAYNSFKGTFTDAMVTAMRKGINSKLYDQGGVLPPGVSVAWNQSGSNELVLPSGVIQGFTQGMQQLHGPLGGLAKAIADLGAQLKLSADAQTAATTATKAATSPTASTKAAVVTAQQKAVTLEQAKLASDKANAAMLASHLKEVQAAIKTTPITDKGQIATDERLAKTIQTALDKANAAAKADQKALNADVKAENQAVVAAMRQQINAITKLLGSGSSATSQSGLWATLAADEKELAQAVKNLTSGSSGGSAGSAGSAAAKTATATTSSAASLAAIKAQIDAQYKLLDQVAKGSPASKAIWDKLDALYKQEDALTKAGVTTAKTGSGGTATSVSTGSSYSVVVDRKAEQELGQIVTQLQAENATLVKILACLGRIETEDAPAAQAKAIGPAVAAALNSTAHAAAGTGGRSTRRG